MSNSRLTAGIMGIAGALDHLEAGAEAVSTDSTVLKLVRLTTAAATMTGGGIGVVGRAM